MMDSAKLMVIYTAISREDVGHKFPHRKYEKDLNNI